MEIRRIMVDELEPVLDVILFAELETLSLTNPQDEAWIRRKLGRLAAAGAEFYGVFEGEMLGFATILVEDRPLGACDGYGACELLQIGIRAEHRSKGLGSHVLAFLEAELSRRRVYCLYLHTYAGDQEAIGFYLKNGYIPRGTVPHVYGPDLEGMLYLSKPLIR